MAHAHGRDTDAHGRDTDVRRTPHGLGTDATRARLNENDPTPPRFIQIISYSLIIIEKCIFTYLGRSEIHKSIYFSTKVHKINTEIWL